MARRNTLRITVPEPCSQSWDEMKSVGQQQRYCDSCASNVVDFTTMTDREVIRFYEENSGPICGQFLNSQLDRSLFESSHPANFWSKAATWAGLLFFGSQVHAQQLPDPASKVQLEQSFVHSKTETDSLRLVEIAGAVYEVGTKEALVGASIQIKGSKRGTYTDIDGTFQLSVQVGDILIVNYLGLKTKSLVVTHEQTNLTVLLDAPGYLLNTVEVTGQRVSMITSTTTCGGSVLKKRRPNTLYAELRKFLRRRKIRRSETEQERTAAKVARRNKRQLVANQSEIDSNRVANPENNRTALFPLPEILSVFPNPASGPINLVFKSETKQAAMVEIVNVNGLPIYLHPWNLTDGENRLTLSRTDHFGVAGTYIIRIVSADGKVEQTKLIIE